MYGKIQSTKAPASENNPASEETKAIVYKTDVNAATGKEKLPEGFPANIPVETDSVQDSIKSEIPDMHVTQYSVTYLSDKSVDAVQSIYTAFFTQEGYTTKPSGQAPVQLYATKNNDDLSVVIETTDTGKTRVFVSYLDRK